MSEDLFRRPYGPPRRKENWFAWTVFILLLLALALGCWIGSFYIFGHPENPRSYAILKKLKKVEPPKRFEITAGPPGDFLSPQKIYERYGTFTSYQLQLENAELMRNYINNYRATKKLVPYVIGRFNILETVQLKPTDLISSGAVAVAQAVDYPQVLLEHVYPAPEQTAPVISQNLPVGRDIRLERTKDLAAIIHVEKMKDGRLQVTAVPLLYGSYVLTKGSGAFSLEPPGFLNLESGAPIMRGDDVQSALKAFADYRRKSEPRPEYAAMSAPTATPTPEPELVRVEATPPPEPGQEITPAPSPRIAAAPGATPETPGPAAAPLRPSAVATPARVVGAIAEPSAVPAMTPRATPPVFAANVTPRPTAPPVATSTPPPADLPGGVELKPFLEARPTPRLTSSGATWPTFAPGQMPKGRVVEPRDAEDLADRGLGGERLYLSGEFAVTFTQENRAALRPPGSGMGRGSVRVIAEFPDGIAPPNEGSIFRRDGSRPFQITDVRRGADGLINVYVREITTP